MERFHEVIPGLLRGGSPSEEDVRALKDFWNVTRIVSLDLEAGEKIASICEKLKIEQIMIPIEMEGMQESLKFLSDNIVDLLSEPTTFVHCVHGKDRTGLAIALFRIKAQDWPLQKALAEALSFGFSSGLSHKITNQYLSVLKEAENGNPEQDYAEVTDAVTQVRDSLLRGNITGPTNGSYYVSPITPVQDLVQDYPKAGPTRDMAESDDKARKRRQKLRRLYLKDMNDAMAYVGMNEINPMLRGLSPEGTGPLGILPYGNYYV